MDYWKNNSKLEHITPPGERFPEVGLFEKLSQVCVGSVFEFGCGDGRISQVFYPDKYHGYDINPHAIKSAKEAYKNYSFSDDWKPADTFLSYTVLLHVGDAEIMEVIKKAKDYNRIVIGEITGRKWRRGGNPPVFNREIDEYERMIGVKADIVKVPYPRYKCDLDLMVFSGY